MHVHVGHRVCVKGLFTIITFPFLFGIMYGDVCHGLMVVFIALYYLYNEKKFTNNRALGEVCVCVYVCRASRVCMYVSGLLCVCLYDELCHRSSLKNN